MSDVVDILVGSAYTVAAVWFVHRVADRLSAPEAPAPVGATNA